MKPELISACQMFLVPSAIMFAALGVAGSEGLKTVICAMGAATSDIWVWTVYRWKDAPADLGVILPPSDPRPVLMLSLVFAAAWGFCFFVHLGLGYVYGFQRQKEAQAMYFTRKPKPVRPISFRRLRTRLRYDGMLLLRQLKKLARLPQSNIPMVSVCAILPG